MQPVRYGIIGIGNMGTGHAAALRDGKVARATVVAVADRRPERREWAAKELPGVAVYEDGLAMIAQADLDVVLIATPHYEHPELAQAAFAAGRHVLCEKPAGVYTLQVEAMNAAAKASGKVFSMMFQQRTHPLHQKARDLVTSGELGDMRRISWIVTDWFRSQSYYDSGGWRATWAGEGGGVLLNQCPHNLDLYWWIPGVMPVRARAFMAFGKYHDIEVEDDVTGYFEYANGATGTFVTTTGEAPGTNRLEITGDRGKLILEAGKLTFFRTRVSVSEFLKTTPENFATPECWTIPVEGRGENTQHVGVMTNVVDAILDGKPLLVPGEEGINGLSLSNAMHLSAWTDGWVDLPLDGDRFLTLLNEKRATSRHKADVSKTAGDMSGSFK